MAKKTAKKAGRPPKGEDKRIRRCEVQASEAEWTLIQEFAAKAGLPVAVYLRQRGLRQI